MPMTRFLSRMTLMATGLAALSFAMPASAQSNPRYIKLAGVPGATKAVLYTPDTGPAPHVAVLVIHRTSNYLSHISTAELPRRGFMVLGMNPRSDNNEAAVSFEDNALDIKAGVNFLRAQPGITKVLLLGHSGGGPATTFYAAVAENGIGYCQGPNKVLECTDALVGLPKIDGIVTADAHPGLGINELRSLNAAVQDETDPTHSYSRRLDPFSAANGYRPSGTSTYSEAFKSEYFKTESRRMNAAHRRSAAASRPGQGRPVPVRLHRRRAFRRLPRRQRTPAADGHRDPSRDAA